MSWRSEATDEQWVRSGWSGRRPRHGRLDRGRSAESGSGPGDVLAVIRQHSVQSVIQAIDSSHHPWSITEAEGEA